MGRFKNKMVVPQGMLAPSGYSQTEVNPVVQSTTRPPGSILRGSPGYDAVRTGKNQFQGKGHTGGFKPMEYAEDIGGSGAALAVIPGDVTQIEATEWLPTDEGDVEEGSLIISDRGPISKAARFLHDGTRTIPDMGDRSPGRPLSVNSFLHHPGEMLRDDYRKNPVVTVLASAGAVFLLYIIGNDLEREYRSRRGRGVVAETTAVPASATATSGDEVDALTQKIGDAGDAVIKGITDAADGAVSAIKDAGSVTKDTAGSVANNE